jgi:nicotinate-nucleotide pyrophosphorylase (carboxylating)
MDDPEARELPDFAAALQSIVRLALAEDRGPGDVTSEAVVPAAARARATVRAGEPGVLSGLAAACEVFRQVDAELSVRVGLEDGARLAPGAEVLRVYGAARSILTAERTALNFLQRLSGVATLTARFVAELRGTGARVLDTRKTTPGLRLLEKAAVRHGGGANHRAGLYDAILIKENHVAIAGGMAPALARAREAARRAEPPLSLVVEAHSLDEVRALVGGGADRVLLDNFGPERIALAVEILRAGPRVEIEVSGGITLENVRAHALPGVDWISVGALTHSAPALDLSLDLEAGA